jgi:hypothetical protein
MQTFVNVLYRLLSNPECIEPLRHDVETAVAEEGWTKAGMDKMHMIDGFLRETQRLDDLDGGPLDSFRSRTPFTDILHFSVSVTRLALRPFTFSNGVTVPPGTLISVPSGAVHKDEEIYPNPNKFDGSRFMKVRKHNVEAMTRYQALSTSVDHLTFGYGRHAWCVLFCFIIALICCSHSYFSVSPGRFFAVNEVKAFLAHIVVTYDIKFEEGKQAPQALYVGSIRIPRKTNVMFRKHQK